MDPAVNLLINVALVVWMLGLVKHVLDDTGKYLWIMLSRIGGECVEQPAFPVDFFTKSSALGLDAGPYHAWVDDDTGLHMDPVLPHWRPRHHGCGWWC